MGPSVTAEYVRVELEAGWLDTVVIGIQTNSPHDPTVDIVISVANKAFAERIIDTIRGEF